MGLNDTPAANRIHIGFFGRRNAGKSSLVNAVTGQKLSVVSETKGTTTDPVYKSMELLPLGPVLIMDTPGIDDEGALGELRMEKTRQVLEKTDIAVLVLDIQQEKGSYEEELLRQFELREIPYVIVYNKCDLQAADSGAGWIMESNMQAADSGTGQAMEPNLPEDAGKGNDQGQQDVYVGTGEVNTQAEGNASVNVPEGKSILKVSSVTGEGINELKERIAHLTKTQDATMQIVGDLLHPMDIVVLVIPIDSSAPKGRLILPQQQVIRDILEVGAVSVVVKDTELAKTLKKLGGKPYMVITDSQAFKRVSEVTPKDIYLTSFSILMARWKGFLDAALHGAAALDDIQEGDEILIAEGCTHHRQCEDIGTVKLPKWICNYTGVTPKFTFTSGGEFPEDVRKYKVVIHCGGCMLNERSMRYRMKLAVSQGVPFTNYGTAIAKMNGILDRSVEVIVKHKEIVE